LFKQKKRAKKKTTYSLLFRLLPSETKEAPRPLETNHASSVNLVMRGKTQSLTTSPPPLETREWSQFLEEIINARRSSQGGKTRSFATDTDALQVHIGCEVPNKRLRKTNFGGNKLAQGVSLLEEVQWAWDSQFYDPHHAL
jgi:hypothetical protein